MASPLRLSVCRRGDDDRSREWEIDAAWAAVRTEFETAEAELSRFRPTSDLTRLNLAAGSGRTRRRPAAARARPRRGGPGPSRHGRPLRSARAPRPRSPRLRGRPDRVATGPRRTRTGPPAPASWIAPGAAESRRPRRSTSAGSARGSRSAGRRRCLERRGVARYLLEAGGDLVARGPGPDGDPWLVGIEDPAGGPDPLGAIAVDAGAVATSSVRLRSWVHDGRTVHHLLDPRTGEPVESGLRAVTVSGPDPAWAEVWSKTLFVGGAVRHRGRGPGTWAGGLVGDRRGGPGDDAGRSRAHGVGRGRERDLARGGVQRGGVRHALAGARRARRPGWRRRPPDAPRRPGPARRRGRRPAPR